MNKFDDRVFLLPHEHETYMRRMPVRYIKFPLAKTCTVCGKPGTANDPLQRAHLIPFGLGIREFKLTPDFLDSPENIVSAHRSVCNKAAELSRSEIEAKIQQYK